jgi:RNA polymerase sigma factor (sigma-70 family)
MNPEITPEELLISVQKGDQESFEKLAQHYTPLLWSITRSHGLSETDANDVIQTTWLRFVENRDRLSSSTELGGWLAATARREAMRVRRLSDRTAPTPLHGPDDMPERESEEPSPEDVVMNAERRRALLQAMEQLTPHCRRLIKILMADPSPSYAEISAALGIPIGSIGPNRARCVQRLRQLLELAEGGTMSAATSAPTRGITTGSSARPADEDMLDWLRTVSTTTVPAEVIEEARRNVSRQPTGATTATLVSDSAVMPHGLENPASETPRLLRFHSTDYEINLQIRSTGAKRSVRGQLDPPQRAHIWVLSEAGVLEISATEPTSFSIHDISAGLVSFHIQTQAGDRLSTDWIAI